MKNTLRFGIIGCSRVAESSTIPAILNSNFAKISYIGSRSQQKAKDFATKFNCTKYGSYEDVLNDADVDAVYISLPIGLHEEWTIKAAKAGKHVLCEKSSTTSFESAKKMVQACKENNVRLMEGFMFRFHPSHKKVRELINLGLIGKVFSFYARYGFTSVPNDDIRYNKELGGGILNDAGCYPICASRILFGKEPVSVIYNPVVDVDMDVDVKGVLTLQYTDHEYAHMEFGYGLYYQSVYSMWGEKGQLSLSRAYNIPETMSASLILETTENKKEFTIESVNHFRLMFDAFSQEIMEITPSCFNFEDDLLKQALVMDAARQSITNKSSVIVDSKKLDL